MVTEILLCKKCYDSGVICTVSRKLGAEYIFRCPCGMRADKFKALPIWQDSLSKWYQIQFDQTPVKDSKRDTYDESDDMPW